MKYVFENYVPYIKLYIVPVLSPGVPTSRAGSIVVSMEPVWRDPLYDGHPRKERAAVVLRLARSWFRFGSFEILAYNNEFELLKQLADFVIKHYFPHIDIKDDNRYLAFYSDIVEQTSHLIAKWQSLGFAHGVCNTDNFSILSITIDYGPFRFLDEYDPEMVPNASDDEARYSYQNQPDVGYFNLDKLRIALSPLLTKDQNKQMQFILNGYTDNYKTEFMRLFRQKLGITGIMQNDERLVAVLLKIMEDTSADFTMTFRQLGEWNMVDMEKRDVCFGCWAIQTLSQHKMFRDWTEMYVQRIKENTEVQDIRQQLMNSINPRYILRNWMAEDVIQKVEKDDFDSLQTLQEILTKPFVEQEQAELLGYADPPPEWSRHLKISCSS